MMMTMMTMMMMMMMMAQAWWWWWWWWPKHHRETSENPSPDKPHSLQRISTVSIYFQDFSWSFSWKDKRWKLKDLDRITFCTLWNCCGAILTSLNVNEMCFWENIVIGRTNTDTQATTKTLGYWITTTWYKTPIEKNINIQESLQLWFFNHFFQCISDITDNPAGFGLET